MTRDLINNLFQNRVTAAGAAAPTGNLTPAVRTATTLSAALDTQGFNSATLQAHIGAYGDVQSGTVYIEAEVQESNTSGSGYTAVADADLIFPPGDAARVGTATGTFFQSKTTAAADLAGLYTVGYRGAKRFLKVNLRFTGSHVTGTPCAVVLTAGNPDYSPTTPNAT